MEVIKAEEMGLCFGVRDALEAAAAVPDPAQVTIHGELVHNPTVTRRLADAGFHQSAEHDRVATGDTPMVLITAHGVSDAERRRLVDAGRSLIDTTCPLVRRAHDAARTLAAEGRHILLVGRAGHVEVRGIVEDLSSVDIIASPDDVERYPHQRLGIISQTTTPPDVLAAVLERVTVLNRESDIRFMDTVCQPTKARQEAVRDLLGRVDAVVVVGGRNSNNTQRLVHQCRERDVRAFHVEGADDLDPAWFVGIETVGLTAGTSTLARTIDEVQRALERLPSPAIA